MKNLLFTFCAAIVAQTALAQVEDPIVMTVNGEDVTRSEFEYSYNKNNTELVVDKASLDEYVELFVNYKLKVAAAKDAQLDTMAAFQKEMADYRAQQAEEYLIDSAFIEAEARKTYEMTARNIGPDGLFQASHILIRLPQQASAAEQARAKQRIDSLYMVLKGGADFAEVAKAHSEDPGSARDGGMLPWFAKGQLLREFEVVALAMQPGELSKPVLTPVGYHMNIIVKVYSSSLTSAVYALRPSAQWVRNWPDKWVVVSLLSRPSIVPRWSSTPSTLSLASL